MKLMFVSFLNNLEEGWVKTLFTMSPEETSVCLKVVNLYGTTKT